jgi:PPOX class probable F420-dependent enzyme
MAAQIPDPVRRFLEKPNVAVLATRSARGLQVTPVWFLYADGHILINTAKGRAKLRNMQAHPEVALAVVNRENPYQYVQIRGKVVGFDTENAARDIDRLSQRYMGQPYAYPGGDHPKNRISIRIQPTGVNAMGL